MQEEDLVQADCECLVDEWVEFAQWGSGEQFQDSIQKLPMAQDPVDQLHGEASFIGRQTIFLHHPIEKRLDRRLASVQVAECFNGGITGSS